MSKKTKEKIKKLPPSNFIKSEEEYKKTKERLEGYIKEYNWLKATKEPAKEVERELRNIMPMINSDNSEAAQKHYLNYSQYLANKKVLIESGEYGTILMQNIKTLFCQIRQYEIDTKEYNTWDIIKGLITRNPVVVEDWKTSKLLSRVRILDGLPKEKDENALSLQPVKDILKYMTKYYNIAGLNLEASEETQLLPAVSDGYLTSRQEKLMELVNSCIIEKGNVFANNEEKKIDSNSSFNEEKRKEQKEMYENRNSKSYDKSVDDKGEIDK